jgi:hypothetical protein
LPKTSPEIIYGARITVRDREYALHSLLCLRGFAAGYVYHIYDFAPFLRKCRLRRDEEKKSAEI